MKTIVPLLSIALLLVTWTLRAGEATTTMTTTRESRRLTAARRLWDERLARADGKPTGSDCYPTEEALVFLTAYDFTRDARMRQQAAVQLDYCHGREVADGLLVTHENLTTRDYQARQIYNFYLAYRILGDGRYLRWADDGAAAMIRLIPRAPRTIGGDDAGGETRTLFLAGYFTPDGKPHHETGNSIDPNQNAEVALAYSLLYHDPASRFFQDPLAKRIAFDELLASMSIQNPASGELPVHESMPDAFDTAYGSYAVFSWVWCQQLWHDERFEKHIRLAAKWLASEKAELTRASQRWYPKRIENGVIPDWEANYRLTLLWHCASDARAFVRQLRERELAAADAADAPVYWAYFDLMGMPRSFFLDGEGAP